MSRLLVLVAQLAIARPDAPATSSHGTAAGVPVGCKPPGPTLDHVETRDRRIVAVALAGFAALFALVKAERSRAFDVAVTLRVQGGRSRTLAAVMRAASWPGFPPQSRIIPPLVVAGWFATGHRRAALFQLAAWGGAFLSTIVKAFVQRPRPLPPEVRVIVAPLGGTSFPSGHVLTYVTFYGFLAHLVAVHVAPPVPRRLGVLGLGGLVALVGPSRVQQGH